MSATTLIDKIEAARLLGGEGKPVSIGFINQLLAKRVLPKVKLSHKFAEFLALPSRNTSAVGRSTPDERGNRT
jgi:hypothetical protein